MTSTCRALALILFVNMAWVSTGQAGDLLDGKVFSGMIGPAGKADLEDNLYFDDGHFWSKICTRCGFVPGVYQSEETADGLRFTGTLESDSRGRFEYEGVLKEDGSVVVSILWERRRWYWTSKREIVFIGELMDSAPAGSLSQTLKTMQTVDPDANPLCARF